nr:immunoglobulin light chain junction region [Macaca mulatta]
CLLYFIGAQVF